MSAILSVDDLNDFITPGVACIKPIETLPAATAESSSALEHEVILDGQQPQSAAAAAAAAGPPKISLTDCLACAGCVTSAEAVLVSLQSHSEVLSTLDAGPALRLLGPDAAGRYTVEGLEDESRKLFVASVSPQTRASLATSCGEGVTEQQAGRMIEQLLLGESGLRAGGKWNNGFTWAFDTNTVREACLVLGSDEVLGSPDMQPEKPKSPILTSSCPGWVCYAEKTHPYVLPHLSRVKSPQALMGTLLKTTLSRTLGIPPDRIWHLAVMPCFDKKLEASREELTDAVWGGTGQPGRGVRDVDCVITSKEILMLAESRSLDFFSLSRSEPYPEQPPFPDPMLGNFLLRRRKAGQFSPAAGTSGGNLHFILQDALSRHPNSKIEAIRGRNVDVVEYVINDVESGQTVFKAARYYGFRNIQNLVRKLKPAKPSRMPGGRPVGGVRRPGGKPGSTEYNYVEVMACPGGCTNGGGQVKVDDPVIMDRYGFTSKPGSEEQKRWLAQVDEAYFSSDESELKKSQGSPVANGCLGIVVDGISPLYVRNILAHWSSITGIRLDRLVYTSFREVISDVGKEPATGAGAAAQIVGKIGSGW